MFEDEEGDRDKRREKGFKRERRCNCSPRSKASFAKAFLPTSGNKSSMKAREAAQGSLSFS